MTINERIINAVTPVVPVCVPEPYDPDEGEASTTFCTFTYTEIPDSFGDNGPEVIRYLCKVTLRAPLVGPNGQSNNTMALRRQLRQAIAAADFTYPTVENLTDDTEQRFDYEFEDCDGEV